MKSFSGGCLCGAIRYSTETADFTAVCHCRVYQKQTGTASSVTVGPPGGGLSISGTLKTFRDTRDSAQPRTLHLAARQFSKASM